MVCISVYLISWAVINCALEYVRPPIISAEVEAVDEGSKRASPP